MEIQTFINILRLGVPALSALIIIGCDQNSTLGNTPAPPAKETAPALPATPPPAKSFTTNITEWQGVQTGMAPAEFARAVGVIDQGGVVEHPKKEYLMHYDPTGKTIDDIELSTARGMVVYDQFKSKIKYTFLMGNFLDGKLISLKVNIADDFMPFETVVAKFIEKHGVQPVSTEVFETVLSKADIRAYPARIWQNRNKILIVYKYPQTTVIFLEDMTDLLPEIQQNQSKNAKSILDKKLDIEKTKF